MTTPMNDEPAKRQPTLTLQVGSWKLTGARAGIVLLVVLGLIGYFTAPYVRWSPLWLSAALWIAFMGYWSAAAKNASAAKSSETRASRARHERLMNGALLLLFLSVPPLRGRFLPPSALLVPLGLSLHAASFLFAIWARRHLGSNWSGAITVKADHELVRSGPYRFIRHPIYTAMLGMFVGTALVSGEWHALLGVAVILYAYVRKIRLEEQTLAGAFGGAYEEYRRASWALVPLVF